MANLIRSAAVVGFGFVVAVLAGGVLLSIVAVTVGLVVDFVL